MLQAVLGWTCVVVMGLSQVMNPPPLQISCSEPLKRVYTRQDKDSRMTCLWKAKMELVYSPSAAQQVRDKPPNCTWLRDGAKLVATSLWSGTVKLSASVGSTVTVQCASTNCPSPACVYQKTIVVIERQDAKLFFAPPPPIRQFDVVRFGWCAKMKSAAWEYQFSSRQTEAVTVIPSNYHTELSEAEYSEDVRNYCSTYYYYSVQVSYSQPGHYTASLTVKDGPMPKLNASFIVEQALLHVLSATSTLLPLDTNLKLSWNFLQLTSKVSTFQLTDVNKAANWDVEFNKYAIKTTDICSPPVNTFGYGFATIQFLTNASLLRPLSGEIDYTKGIVGLTTTKNLGSVSLHSEDAKMNTYYFSQHSGLYFFSSDDGVDAGCSVHFIFCQQEGFTFLFQIKKMETEKYNFLAHVYLNTRGALYKSLEDVGVEIYFFNSGPTQLYSLTYLVWFIPLQYPHLQCKWTFILELYGPAKTYLFTNTTYTYKDAVSNAATFIPNLILPFNSNLYAGFVAKVNATKSGLRPVILKTNVGTYASKVLETSVYWYKIFCEIILFQIQKPEYPSIIVTTKGAHLSIFVNAQINCSASPGAKILWRIYSVSSASVLPKWDNYLTLPQVSTVNQNNIEIPRFTLNYGFYIFNVSIEIATDDDEDDDRSNTDSVVVEVRESDLIAVIKGGSFRSVGFGEKWTLDGRFSYDPDSPDPSTGLSFVWYCSKMISDYAHMILSAKANCHPDQTSLLWVNAHTVTQTVDPETLQGNRHYYFRLFASKGNKTSYVDQTVFIVPGSPPGVSVTCIENCLPVLVPTERFSLSGKCTDCSKTSRPVYEWSLFQDLKEVHLDFTSQTTTGRSIAYISFIASTFIDFPNMWYTLQLQLTTWAGTPSLFKYRFYVNSPPKPGDCHIKPSTGFSLKTMFTVTCSGFSDQNLPLRYKFIAASGKLGYVSSLRENSLGTIIYDGYNSTAPPLVLSIGDSSKSYSFKLYVQVYDFLCSYTQINCSVTVKNLYEGKPQEAYLKDLISMANSPLMHFFLEIGDFIKSGHFAYTIASVLNVFSSTNFLYPLKDKRSELRESLLNVTSSIMTTNIMAVNQIVACIQELTQDPKELKTKSQQIAVSKLKEVGDVLNQYRKDTIGSVDSEILSSGILTSLSNIIEASLFNISSYADDIPSNKVEVLKDTLSIMETVTDIVSYGKVPGEAETFMVNDNFRIALKKKEKWDLEGSYRKTRDCLTCFYPKFEDNESVFPIDATVTAAFYEFKENPLPWLKNGNYIDTVVTGFHIAATSNKGVLNNLSPKSFDIIMERKNIIPSFDVLVSPDVEKITSGSFCFEVNLEQKAEWFVQFFYTKKITFNISLHIGDNITDDPVAFFQIPKVEMVQMESSKDPDLKTWNSKMIRIPVESLPKTPPVQNLTMELTTNYLVWKKTNLLRASIFNIACLDFEVVGNNWNDANCKVGPLTNTKVIHCICDNSPKAQGRNVQFLKKKHTFLAARVLVMPNPIDLTKTTFRALQSNLVTLSTVVVIFVVYFVLAIWARIKDKSDLISKHTVIVLPDNDPYETEPLLVTLYTGSRFGSGTTADVYLKIEGEAGDTPVHHLKCPGYQVFVRGGIDTFLITTKYSLGDIINIRVWHNNFGDSPSWFLSRIKVEDMNTNQVWYFVCQTWLAIGKSNGLIHRRFAPLKTDKPLHKIQYFLISLSVQLCEEHLWFSVFLTAFPEAFSRLRRLTCCMVILFSTLLVNIMFFNAAENDVDEPKIQFLKSFMVGFESSLIATPIQLIVLLLLKFTEDKPLAQLNTFSENMFLRSSEVKVKDLEEGLKMFYQTPDNKDSSMEINSVHSALCSLASLASFATKQQISQQLSGKINHRLNNSVLSETVANKIYTFAQEAPEEYRQSFKENGRLKKWQVMCLECFKQISFFDPPWWCIYVAWSIVFVTLTVSAILIIMYGLSYGYELSITWLLASATSFFQSAFVFEIVKIVFIDAVNSCFPKFYQHIPWPSSYFQDNSSYKVSINVNEARKLHYKLLNLRNSKHYQPPTDDEIAILRNMATIKRKAYLYIWNLISHIVFLTLLLLFVYSTDYNVFYYNQDIRKRFSYNLESVDRIDKIYNWTREIFLPLIHNQKQPGFIVESWSKIVALPRMRQVKSNSFNHTSSTGYSLLSYALSSIKNIGISNGVKRTTVNKESNPSEYIGYTYENYTLPGDTFGSGDYTVYLFPKKNVAHSLDRIQELQNSNWLNEETGAVVIELATFNADACLFCSISVTFEASVLGRINTELSVYSFTMSTFQDLDTTKILLILALFVFMIIYIVDEIHTIVQVKKSYVNVANIINLLLKILLFLSAIFFFTKLILASDLLDMYSVYTHQFIPFYIVCNIDRMFRETLGFLVFFTLLKSLYYTNHICSVHKIEKALRSAFCGICGVALVGFICFTAFATFGYLVYGQHEWSYHTYLYSIQTLLSYSVSSSRKSFSENRSCLGVLYLSVFLFVMICILINLLLVVIISTYKEMKHPVLEEASDEAKMIAC